MKKCKKCLVIKDVTDFYKHKASCKSCYLESRVIYRLANLDKIAEKNRKDYQKNKVKVNIRKKEYNRLRRLNDPLYSLRCTISRNIRMSINRNGFSKSSNTEYIIGCSFEEFKIYLESKFEDWMNWDNKGLYNGELSYGWDIDHIIPISSTKSEQETILLSHYSNLQPLCSKINRDIKKDTINFTAMCPLS